MTSDDEYPSTARKEEHTETEGFTARDVLAFGVGLFLGCLLLAAAWYAAGAAYRWIDPGPCSNGRVEPISIWLHNSTRDSGPTGFGPLCVPAGLVWIGTFLGLTGTMGGLLVVALTRHKPAQEASP